MPSSDESLPSDDSLLNNLSLGSHDVVSSVDQHSDFADLEYGEQVAVDDFLSDLDQQAAEAGEQFNRNRKRDRGGESVEWIVDQEGRIIIKFFYPNGDEMFHISSFRRIDEKTGDIHYGGIHITWPCPGCSGKPWYKTDKKGNTKGYIYLKYECILRLLGDGYSQNESLKIIEVILDRLIHYFDKRTKYSKQDEAITDLRLLDFLDSCVRRGRGINWTDKDGITHPNWGRSEIANQLREIKSEVTSWRPWQRQVRQKIPEKIPGGSTKKVMYLVKIDKLKQKNKLLKKDKIKNKNKIEKNNKLIDELKAKAKKEKAKAKAKKEKAKAKAKAKKEKEKAKAKAKIKKEKAKAKKEKEKAKAKKEKVKAKAKTKKVTCKKSTCSKKNKK